MYQKRVFLPDTKTRNKNFVIKRVIKSTLLLTCFVIFLMHILKARLSSQLLKLEKKMSAIKIAGHAAISHYKNAFFVMMAMMQNILY